MDALILFSHGSVLCGAERNLLAIAAQMRAAGDADLVEAAFLNYIAPDLESVVATCVTAGAGRIVVVPYFLIAGKFVKEDLAAVVAVERSRYPELEFIVADVIGFHESLADAVETGARAGSGSDAWGGELLTAGEFCRENPRCPIYGTPTCRVTSAPHP